MPKEVEITIDPTNMKGEEPLILGQLLKTLKIGTHLKAYDPNFYTIQVKSVTYKVRLVYEIYKENDEIFRVKKKIIGAGGQAKIFTAGTLKSQDDGSVLFKAKPQHKRVIKQQHFEAKVFQNMSEADIKEYFEKMKDIAEKPRHLHSKVTYAKNDDGSYSIYTIMHKFKSKNLLEIINDDRENRQQLSVEMRSELTRKILLAVKEQIYDRGIVHRDIKPQNIIVDIDYAAGKINSVNIIDFDHAKNEHEPDTGAPFGSNIFHAPEILKGLDTNHYADMYSLALTLGLLWGGDQKKILRDKDNYLDVTFKPSFTLDIFDGMPESELSKGDRDAMLSLFENMSAYNRDERYDIISAIKEHDSIEFERLHRNTDTVQKDIISNAHEKAYDVRANLAKLSEEFQSRGLTQEEFLQCLADSIPVEIKDISEALKKSPTAVHEFIDILDIKAFANLDSIEAIQKMSDDIISKFTNYKQDLLAVCRDKNTKKQDLKTFKEAKRILKKLQKCSTFDEIYEFNQFMGKEILALCQRQKSGMESILIREINNASNRDELQKIVEKIKSDENRFIQKERGAIFKLFGEYGVTTTWQNIIRSLQNAALGLLKEEIQNSPDKEQIGGILSKYDVFFKEKSGRLFNSEFADEFEQLKKQYSVSAHTELKRD